jgi:glucosamine-6-phosphate deaminase
MKILISENYDALSKKAAGMVVEQLKQKPASLLCFPSGESPTGMLKYLVSYAREGKADFSACSFIGLDEWAGMSSGNEGSCSHYLFAHFFTPMHIAPARITLFNGMAADAEVECERINSYLAAHGPIDMMIVGVGLNGHLGLNEPGADPQARAHVNDLDPLTVTVAQKYFSGETHLTKGLTLGLKNLQEAKTAVLIASGSKKAAIIAKALKGEVTPGVPASIMQKIDAGYVLLDEDAAKLLGE